VNNEKPQPNASELSEQAMPDGPATDLPTVTPEAQVEELTAERDRLAAENRELQDRVLRRQADYENLRRRVERERSEFTQYAAMELVRDLLPVLDDFERALRVETADKEYVKGIELKYNRFFETLKKLGLEPIETAGKPFDPNVHQAIDKVESEDAEDNTILHEHQRGYNFKGKLLRPSMVRVAVRR
jgi:molecular chaperone GrpE